jgi:hypothetical protein
VAPILQRNPYGPGYRIDDIHARMKSTESDYRYAVLSHTVILQSEMDSQQRVMKDLPGDHVCRERLEAIHQAISNVIAIMKKDLVDLG